jgi:hypothetical protein
MTSADRLRHRARQTIFSAALACEALACEALACEALACAALFSEATHGILGVPESNSLQLTGW